LFRERFEREVDYLWQSLRRLTERYPRLEALYTRNADARVARLVQSAAFGFASVHARIHDDGQALVRPLVGAAMPECLRPRPSSTILKVSRSPDPNARFLGQVGPVQVPFELKWGAQFASFDLADIRVERVHATLQVLRMTLLGPPNVPLGSVLPDTVRFFVRLESASRALDLVHALRTSIRPVAAHGYDERGKRVLEIELPPASIRWTRVDAPEASLTSAPGDRFVSSTDLRDLYAFPESFCFFDVALAPVRVAKLAKLDLVLPLARILDGIADFGAEHLHIACAPATNEYRARIEPLRESPGTTEWPLTVAGRPHAEVLHVRELGRLSTHDAHTRQPILSWESPTQPHRFEDEDLYFLVEQSIAVNEPRTETRVSFASAASLDRPLPGVVVEGEVLASDGGLTAKLGLGDIGRGQGAENITRVSPSRRAILGENYAWRMNAYARMPPTRFVTASYLHEFFELHDSSDIRDEQARIQVPSFGKVAHAREHRLVDGMLEWGDAFRVDLVAPLASEGEAWLLGELLSRAIAERNERLRFSRLSMTVASTEFATFSTRQGDRFPFPIG
jgi:type VI protein secretion system component VasA